jgi:hypothetical protein
MLKKAGVTPGLSFVGCDSGKRKKSHALAGTWLLME